MASPNQTKFRKFVDEPTMSDNTLLLKVDDLIAMSFGMDKTNLINFKMVQTVLYILARQMRLLEQDIEIRFDEEDDLLSKFKQTFGEAASQDSFSSGEEEGKATGKAKTKKSGKGTKATKDDLDAGGGPDAVDDSDTKDRKAGKRKTGDATKSLRDESKRRFVSKKSGDAEKEITGQPYSKPAKTDSRTRVGSIEVVTASQFNVLESMVKHLLKRTGDVPLPTLPSNENLLAELAKGTASLADTMDAMQVNARVKAAELGLSRMAELLTHLAKSGALPPAAAALITQMQADLQQLSLGEQPMTSKTTTSVATDVSALGGSGARGAASMALAGVRPRDTFATRSGQITRAELDDALRSVQEELMKNIEQMTTKSTQSSDHASHAVKSVEEKLGIAVKADQRITEMHALTAEYAAQLRGFDTSLNFQLQSFRDMMGQLRCDLDGGLHQMEAMNNNPESAALSDIRTGYEGLQLQLERSQSTLNTIVKLQKHITDELKGLVESVEMLREQKADRDEVADGLRDKANLTRLKGFLRDVDFEAACFDLKLRLDKSYEKFVKQEQVWMVALQELTDITDEKAHIMQLLSVREFATRVLNEQAALIHELEVKLGEPKTALMARELSRNGHCGPCLVPALMEPYEKRSSVPPELPALRHKGAPAEPCVTRVEHNKRPEDTRSHVCKRWVGGSHTLLSEHVVRQPAAPPAFSAVPTRHYEGLGVDGRLYKMDEECQPCIECNKVSPAESEGVPPPDDGGGDTA